MPNVRIIRVMSRARDRSSSWRPLPRCGRRPHRRCHIGDCHYVEGNYKAVRRVRISGASSSAWHRGGPLRSNGFRPPKRKGKAGDQRHGGQGARARPLGLPSASKHGPGLESLKRTVEAPLGGPSMAGKPGLHSTGVPRVGMRGIVVDLAEGLLDVVERGYRVLAVAMTSASGRRAMPDGPFWSA